MLVVSHDGRGVFEVGSWKRIARDFKMAYPNDDAVAIGIGPIDGQSIAVQELDYSTELLVSSTPDNRFKLSYETGMLSITPLNE